MNIENLQPYEKEEIFSMEVNRLIDRFCMEYKMTYAQVVGILTITISDIINESSEGEEE